jgi:AraC-like DNA-binding protein
MRDFVAHFAWNGQFGHKVGTIGKLVHTSHGPAAFDWPIHDHDFYEITMVVEGSAIHHSDYGLWEVCRGKALFIKPGSWHACSRCKDLVVLNACFPADLISGELGATVRGAHLAVNPSHLARSFKATFGLAPMSYLTGVRAEVAATLLLQTDRPIAAIGAEVGWPDPNYFARRFRAHVGTSPSAYRAAQRVDTAVRSTRSLGVTADQQSSC